MEDPSKKQDKGPGAGPNRESDQREAVGMPQHSRKERAEVVTVRNWKEYLGESFLIIFSVMLALGLTEWFSKLHEEKQTRQVLHQLRDELISNKEAEEDQYQYHLKILGRIDSAMANPQYAQKFINNGEVHIGVIIDSGVLRHDLNEIAWQIAKEDNVLSKLDIPTYSLLTEIYDNQQKIANAESEIGKLLLSWESRKPENLKTTLILIKDTYVGWATGRTPDLLANYNEAIDRLKNY